MGELLPWGLYLFFSADLVGSTAYKSRMGESQKDDWRFAFSEFYHDFPSFFTRNTMSKNLPKPNVWKFLGDEILFFVKLAKSEDTLFYIKAFQKTLAEYTTKPLNDDAMGLSCKGSAWTAGFPVGNFEVVVNSPNDNNDTIVDFIGPSIDCGFRVAHHSTRRKLTISVELALMIAKVMCERALDKPTIKYDGRIELKGVLDGKPYPLFWVDCASATEVKEDKLLNHNSGCKSSDVMAFCIKYIEQTKGICCPFIENDPSEFFKKIPEKLEERRKAISEVAAESSPDDYSEQDHESKNSITIELPTPHES